jgi:putative SOS response-associated peptidase YedK
MCGRFQLNSETVDVAKVFGTSTPPDLRLPALNVAPTSPVPVVVQSAHVRQLKVMRWGFPALWLAQEGKDPWRGRALFNTRAEHALQKRTWSGALEQRRCLVPTTGFYEWVRRGRDRLPLHFERADGELMALGAVWQRFERDGQRVDCVSILTTRANPTVAPVHDRMPVVVDRARWGAWMAAETPLAAVKELLLPWSGALSRAPVSTALNSSRFQESALPAPDWSPEAGAA